MEVIFFILGMFVWQIMIVLAVAINQMVISRRQKKFLKLVDIKFPDHTKVTLISIDASDKRAMAKLERQLREQYEYEEDEIRWRDRGDDREAREGSAGAYEAPPQHRSDSPR